MVQRVKVFTKAGFPEFGTHIVEGGNWHPKFSDFHTQATMCVLIHIHTHKKRSFNVFLKNGKNKSDNELRVPRPILLFYNTRKFP